MRPKGLSNRPTLAFFAVFWDNGEEQRAPSLRKDVQPGNVRVFDMVNTSSSLPRAGAGSEGGGRPRRGRSRRPTGTPQLEQGKWIWVPDPESSSNTFICARKLFDLPSRPALALLKVAAATAYKLFVNGRYVGKGPVPDGHGHSVYDTHDVTELLTKGRNVFAFLVHYAGEGRREHRPTRPGLLCQTEIEIGEEKLVIATDETWKVRRATEWSDQGALIGEGLGFQELYDAAARVAGWEQVKFNERGWEQAVEIGASGSMPWGRLIARGIPQLAEESVLPRNVVGVFNAPPRGPESPIADLPESISAAELVPLSDGSVKNPEALTSEDGVTHVKTPRGDSGTAIILDFGREVYGNVEVGIKGSGAGCIDIGYSETLEDGRVKPNRGGLRYADRVLLHKGGLHWQSFQSRAFRFLQIEFRRCTRTVALEYVRVNLTSYPVKLVGTFECSDPVLNDIWQAAAYTTRLCMQETYISDPWRDRRQQWGETRALSRVAGFVFDDSSLLAQAIRQTAECQHRDGAIPLACPLGDGAPVSDYAFLWVFSILDHYAFSDDSGPLRRSYPNVRRLMEWFGRWAGEDGLLSNVPGRLYIDAADMEKRGTVTALNCLYYQGLRVAGVIASIAGMQHEAEDMTAAAGRLRIAINKHLYSPTRGLYADSRVDGKLVENYSRQTNILAALFDIPDHYQKSTICRQLLNGALPEIATPFFTSLLLEVLYSADLHPEALDIIRRRWGVMVEAGSGTTWERFDQDGSLCHGSSVSPARDLIAEYVGIKPILGSHRFSVAPHTGGLKWAKGTVNTKSGPLTVDWRAGRDYLVIHVDVPQGLRVDVYPPGPANSRISLDGKHQPGRFLTLGAGSHQVKVVVPRPERAPRYDESLAPEPIEHVEILGELYSRARRRRDALDRRRGKTRIGDLAPSRRRGAEPEVEIPKEVEGLPEDERFVLVEEVREEMAETAPGMEGEEVAAAAAEVEPRTRRRRSRRGGRGRARAAGSEAHEPESGSEPSSIHAAESVDREPEHEPAVEQPETEAAPTAPRRRSRRGGRGRSRSAGVEQPEPSPGIEAVEEAAVQPVVEEPNAEAAEGEAAPSPRRRSRRGGRRHRPSEGRAEEGQTPTDDMTGPAPEPPAAPEPVEQETSVDSDAKPRRRTRRGGRRHHRPQSAESHGSVPEPAGE
jgi:alpha-L-rhamnosidase